MLALEILFCRIGFQNYSRSSPSLQKKNLLHQCLQVGYITYVSCYVHLYSIVKANPDVVRFTR